MICKHLKQVSQDIIISWVFLNPWSVKKFYEVLRTMCSLNLRAGRMVASTAPECVALKTPFWGRKLIYLPQCVSQGSGCKQNNWTLVNLKAFIPASGYSQNQKEDWRSRFQNCTGSRGNQEAGRTQLLAAQARGRGDAPEVFCPPHTH